MSAPFLPSRSVGSSGQQRSASAEPGSSVSTIPLHAERGAARTCPFAWPGRFQRCCEMPAIPGECRDFVSSFPFFRILISLPFCPLCSQRSLFLHEAWRKDVFSLVLSFRVPFIVVSQLILKKLRAGPLSCLAVGASLAERIHLYWGSGKTCAVGLQGGCWLPRWSHFLWQGMFLLIFRPCTRALCCACHTTGLFLYCFLCFARIARLAHSKAESRAFPYPSVPGSWAALDHHFLLALDVSAGAGRVAWWQPSEFSSVIYQIKVVTPWVNCKSRVVVQYGCAACGFDSRLSKGFSLPELALPPFRSVAGQEMRP